MKQKMEAEDGRKKPNDEDVEIWEKRQKSSFFSILFFSDPKMELDYYFIFRSDWDLFREKASSL